MKKRTIIITGSSSGIGKEMARLFLKKGDNVVITSVNADRLKLAYQELGASESLHMIPGDISDRAFNIRLITEVTEKWETVDVLINNAGIFEPKPFLSVEEADLDRFLNINLKGTYFTTQAAIRVMLKQNKGHIINIGTALVEHAIGGLPASAAVVSKAGIHTLAKQLAAEFGKNNIMINTIVPGVIRTPLHEKGGIDADNLGGMHLLNRIGEAEDIAQVAYMLSNNNFITGTTINVDGGHTAGHHFA